jgi:hypothetical protein
MSKKDISSLIASFTLVGAVVYLMATGSLDPDVGLPLLAGLAGAGAVVTSRRRSKKK